MLWLLLDRLEVLFREVLGAPDLSARAAPERHRMPTATTAMMFFIRPLGASWDAPCARSIARLPTTYEGLRSLINNSNVRRQVNLSLTRPTGGIIERTRRRGSHIGLHVTADTRLSSWNYWTVRRPRREERRAAGGATCGVSPIVPNPANSSAIRCGVPRVSRALLRRKTALIARPSASEAACGCCRFIGSRTT